MKKFIYCSTVLFVFLIFFATGIESRKEMEAFMPGVHAESQAVTEEEDTCLLQAEYNGSYIQLTCSGAGLGEWYEIARSDTKNGKYKLLKRQKQETYKDKTVKEGQVYYYKLRLVNGGKKGAWSDAIRQACPLKQVEDVSVVRYSSTALKIKWCKNPKARYYKVYRRKGKKGKYKLVAVTKKPCYISRKLSKNTKYYFKVQACASKYVSEVDSKHSKEVGKNTKKFKRVTVFAGDSLMTGIRICDSVKDIDIGGKKKVVAYKGLSTVTFQTKKVFDDKTGLEQIISYHPYRLYIMLGMNDAVGQKPSQFAKNYKKIIKQVQKESPDTEIVLLAVSPVSKSVLSKRKCFRRIPDFNKQISRLAKEYGLEYYDYTEDYKNSKGTLNHYNGGDGIHWSKDGYDHFAKILEKLDKRLDP